MNHGVMQSPNTRTASELHLIDMHVPLLEHEEENEESKRRSYKFISVFGFGTWHDILLYFIGGIAAIVFGTILPLQSAIVGRIFSGSSGIDPEMLSRKIHENIPNLLKLGAVAFVSGLVQHVCIGTSSQRIVKRMRIACLDSILKQEVSFFDASAAGTLSTTITDQSQILLRGLSDSVGSSLNYLSQMITGFIIAFTMCPKVAFGMLLIVPVNSLIVIVIVVFILKRVKRVNKTYEKAGGFVEEVLSGIQTVASLNAQESVVSHYDTFLAIIEGLAKAIHTVRAMGVGAIYCGVFVSYGIGYYFGSKVVANMDASFGDVLSSVFSCVIGSIAIGIAMPNLTSISEAKEANQCLMELIDRIPLIESKSRTNSSDAMIMEGTISFRDVAFRYPGRDQWILNGVSFVLEAGKTYGLCGPSGCGKSTCIALLERFYEPERGSITIDGTDIRMFSLEYLRSHISLVSQEPILFDASIRENILMGNANIDEDDSKSHIDAAKRANAHDFIMDFPDGYETQCGERGGQMSGGQKQRIAIARALIRKPKILLLDEATSALDAHSEIVVQASIDQLLRSSSLTTIVIAHRLSTIRNADEIIVLDPNRNPAGGAVVVEAGSHDSLMKIQDGVYRSLVETRITEPPQDEIPMEPAVNHHRTENNHLEKRFSSVSSLSASSLFHEEAVSLLEDDTTEDLAAVDYSRVWNLSRPEYRYFFSGTIGAALKGAVQPCMSLVLSHLLTSFVVIPIPLLDLPCKQDSDCPVGFCFDFSQFDMHFKRCCKAFIDGHTPDSVRATGVEALKIYLGLGLGVGVGLATSIYSFAYAGIKLTRRLRQAVFSSLCRQDSTFFDQPQHNIGTLQSRLQSDTMMVQHASGDYLGLFVENIVATTVALCIAFASSWRMSIVVSIPCGLLVYSSFQDQIRNVKFVRAQVLDKNADRIVHQALSSVRTIYSITAEASVISRYSMALEAPYESGVQASWVTGMQTGVSQAMYQVIYSFTFWYGAILIGKDLIDSASLSRVFFVLTLSAMFIGMSIARANDQSKAKIAISRIFELLDSKSPSDFSSREGIILPQRVKGDVSFRNVSFAYPTRLDCPVLKSFSCEIPAGSMYALVGSSGSGKSSIIKLLERFYELPPENGAILVDNVDIRQYNVRFLRSQISLVSQEPILFDGTIMDNVLFGNTSANLEQVYQACKIANAHDFISEFPDQYNTICGSKGSQLSGGQKQRIAIARAILRNPSILLLDEATSALDNESAALVQAALDSLVQQQRRTTIVIAHQLSTIQNADCILVLEKGCVVEQGSHTDLLKIPNGIYKSMITVASKRK